MNKLSIILVLLTVVIFAAGCTGKTNENNSTNSQNTQEKTTIVETTQLKQINASLQKGPVLLKIGAEWCGECQAMKPILAQVAAEYTDKVTVMSVDINQSPKLADYFGINVIPDTSVIVGIENGEYVYMREDGNVSTDRFKARILKGVEDKKVFEKILNFALQSDLNKRT